MGGGYYDRVPKELVRNLRFRLSLLRQAGDDEELQGQLWEMCKRDVLFFINVFLYVFEPRSRRHLPFITWSCQDRAIEYLVSRIMSEEWVRRDVPIEKSRDMGVTWFCVAVFVWLFVFYEDTLGCVASRVENLVEDASNHKALLWKFDYLLEGLPSWMRPEVYRAKNKRKNLENGSMVNGDTTNADMFRGDRALYVFLDEFAAVKDGHSILRAVRDVTFCVIANSTHQGVRTAFYEMVSEHRRLDVGSVLRLHWSEHPFKRRGLYRGRAGGGVEILDVGYRYGEDYPFVLDGRLRSVAYDNESRTRHVREMAQEWDIDPVGADWQYFSHQLIDELLTSTARPPLWRGEIEYLVDPVRFVRFVPHPEGRFLFWCELGGDGYALRDRDYGIGVDCGRGVGSSNSVLCVGDKKSRELVCEFADPHVKMDELAEIAAALGQCFGGGGSEALMGWEANGPGSEFGKYLLGTCGYRHVFMRSNERSIKKSRSGYEPGWWASRENKQREFGLYEQALRGGTFINRSEWNLREHFNIIWTSADRIVHNGAMEGDEFDPAGAGNNHGDRVTGAVLCHKMMGPMDRAEEEEVVIDWDVERVIPGTFSERFAEAEMSRLGERELSW